MTAVPTIPLKTPTGSVDIPQLGFGVWQVETGDAVPAVTKALEVGYRHVDTAAAYGNEEQVGRALAQSDVDAADVFVTTKLWNDRQGFDSTLAAFDESMGKLGLETLDLYLIHWPVPKKDAFVDTWKAFQKLRDEGRVRAIGVCNFQVPHLQRLLDETGELPAINQIELHPHLVQQELRDFHVEHGIVTEDWSPLASGGDVLTDDTIAGIAKAHDVTPAQAILRWHLQLGSVVIPKSVTPSRIEENFDVFGFELTDDEVATITALDKHHRTGPDPDEFNLGA
ncbi:aldo/keto reductase [Lapillicoccus jejuensis]|uniref:Diketogulonate reductase-like aldo/keto reductase n=1 Tax=Lapillicoccus jejuensis TaxID=402171 RepID=A0A542E284_9MICO|nr:aldo/keto reductase [Lapillicoccus jejuensis]TQJ09453.1 diketogulonate reductase-like aldo/keto reductase [Lapillicoccus jejuensis]